MTTKTFFNSNNGEILCTYSSSSFDEATSIKCVAATCNLAEISISTIVGQFSHAEYFVKANAPTLRPDMEPAISKTEVLADGDDEVLITNLPIPATVNVKGQIVEVDDGELVLTFETPGKYRLTVEAFPHKPWEVTIHAT